MYIKGGVVTLLIPLTLWFPALATESPYTSLAGHARSLAEALGRLG